MTNAGQPPIIKLGNKALDYVDEYMYLGQLIKFGKPNQIAETERIIRLALATFGKERKISTHKKIPLKLWK